MHKMGNFIKNIITKINSGRSITDGKPIFSFLSKYIKNENVLDNSLHYK